MWVGFTVADIQVVDRVDIANTTTDHAELHHVLVVVAQLSIVRDVIVFRSNVAPLADVSGIFLASCVISPFQLCLHIFVAQWRAQRDEKVDSFIASVLMTVLTIVRKLPEIVVADHGAQAVSYEENLIIVIKGGLETGSECVSDVAAEIGFFFFPVMRHVRRHGGD